MMIWYFLFLISVQVVVDGATTTEAPDPCDIYNSVPDAFKRYINYTSSSGINDRYILEGWYGIQGFIIPTQVPESGQCGVDNPIYMQDDIDRSNANIQTLTACIRGFSIPCQVQISIQAKVCSATLVVYYIKKASSSGSAYCIGPETGDSIPEFRTIPSVVVATEQSAQSQQIQQFRFTCPFTSVVTNLYYRADWFVNNRFIYSSSQVGYTDDAERSITEAQLAVFGIKSVGFDIVCEIRASFGANSSTGLPSTSQPVFIGIKILTPTVTVPEGKTGTIKFKPTAQIGCGTGRTCDYGVTTNIPQSDVCSPTVRADKSCGVSFDTANWNREHSIKVTGVVTDQYGQNTATMIITLISALHYLSHPIWGNYTLPPVTVFVTKDTRRLEWIYCIMYLDPYVYTFDRRHSSLQMTGTYTMYLNEENKIEVQVKTQVCSSRNAYCNCGVIIRVGRTVYMINHCSLDHWYIDYILCDDGGDMMDIKRRSSSVYQILLPTGTKINIRLRPGPTAFLNVYIFPSVVDVGVSRGLCGNFNADVLDDYNLRDGSANTNRDSYFSSWRVTTMSNLFNPDNLINLDGWNRQYLTCKCHEVNNVLSNEVDCTPSSTVTCIEDANYRKVHQKRCISATRRKRSLPTYIPDSDNTRTKRDVSWKNGWSADAAKTYCENLFNSSSIVKQCADVPGVDFESPLVDCQQDIQVSGTTDFALSAINGLQSQCLREAVMNTTLHKGTPEKKSILDLVKAVACPGECSNNGVCNNGTCDCNDDFIGDDCSVNNDVSPKATSLEGDGKCDIKAEECTDTGVYGGTFVETNNVRCKLTPFQVNEAGDVTERASETATPTVESLGEVTCPLPAKSVIQKRSLTIPVIDETVSGYRISVTNNGANYSQELTMVIINSDCMSCNITGNIVQCVFYINYCILNNQCFQDGQRYPDNTDYVCRANSGVKTWENTKTTTNNPSRTTTTSREKTTENPSRTTTVSPETTTENPSRTTTTARETTTENPSRTTTTSRETTTKNPSRTTTILRETTTEIPSRTTTTARETTTENPSRTTTTVSRETTTNNPSRTTTISREKTTENPYWTTIISRETTTNNPSRTTTVSPERTTENPSRTTTVSREMKTTTDPKLVLPKGNGCSPITLTFYNIIISILLVCFI